jgi:voltage-gated potassium channel
VTFVFVAALGLVTGTVAVHVVGLTALLRYYLPGHNVPAMGFWAVAGLLIRISWALVLIHVAEIALWAWFWLWSGCLSNLEPALYFSGVTYATIGYGDLVLPPSCRVLAPVEGLTGTMMCGLSTALFFAFLSRIYSARHRAEPQDE